MAFLDSYSDTRRVPVGDPERGYWVELREVLLQGDKEAAERALISGRVQLGKDAEMQMDHVGYRELMLLASVVAWNLDDPGGAVWPVTLDSVRRLPGIEFERLARLVDEMNAPPGREETKRFPDGSVSGDQVGERRTTVTGHVLARTPDVDAAGTPAGGPARPAMA